MINVLIVDDSELACKGVKVNIDCDEIQSTYVTSSKSCIIYLKSNQQDVVVLDYRFPGDKDGFVQALSIRKRYPKIKILFLSSDDSPTLANVLYHTGDGYMSKSSVFSYKEAIFSIYNGKQYIQPDIAKRTFTGDKDKITNQRSLRKKQISLLSMTGYSCHLIAELLHISLRTVTRSRVHMQKVLDDGSNDYTHV